MGTLVDGVWQYDEADDAAPVSDLLNLLGDSVRDRTESLDDKIDSRERSRSGTATLTSPTTAVATTGVIAFGVTYAAPPNVVVGTVVTIPGLVVNAYAITVTTTGFQIRYRATGTVGSNVTVSWVASGTAA